MEEDTSGGSGGGSEINGAGMSSMDSLESRWVFQHDDDSAIDDEDDDNQDDDPRYQTLLDSEDEDNVEPRLIRTGPRIDSFDVEALEVPGAQRNDYEVRFAFYFSVNVDECMLGTVDSCIVP